MMGCTPILNPFQKLTHVHFVPLGAAELGAQGRTGFWSHMAEARKSPLFWLRLFLGHQPRGLSAFLTSLSVSCPLSQSWLQWAHPEAGPCALFLLDCLFLQALMNSAAAPALPDSAVPPIRWNLDYCFVRKKLNYRLPGFPFSPIVTWILPYSHLWLPKSEHLGISWSQENNKEQVQ